DFNRFHERHIDHQPIVAHCCAGGAVSAAANCHEQLVLVGKTHGGHDVPIIRTERNERRPTIDPPIPDSSSFVVTSVSRRNQPPTQLLAKGSNYAVAQCLKISHRLISTRRTQASPMALMNETMTAAATQYRPIKLPPSIRAPPTT